MIALGVVAVTVVSVAVLAGAPGSAESGQVRWVMTDLGTLGGRYSVAMTVNAHGQIAGTSRTAGRVRHVFLWQKRRMIDIGRYGNGTDTGRPMYPTLLLNEPGQVVWEDGGRGWFLWDNGVTRHLAFGVRAMNDLGQIVGGSTAAIWSDHNHAVLWENGRLRDLGVPPGDTTSNALALNNRGVVVGESYGRRRGEQVALWTRAFMRKNGKISVLGLLPGFASCHASAVNSAGQVLGYCDTYARRGTDRLHAVLWDDKGTRNLGVLGDDKWVLPVALNNRGQVVGRTTVGGTEHAFLWQGGKMLDLGGRAATPAAINDQGQVVGYGKGPQGARHAFLWQNGKRTDLGTLGGRDSYAWAINNGGQIVGSATAEDGTTHAVLWTLKP